MKKITVIALLLAAALGAQARNGSGKPAYKDAGRPVEERVSDLLSRMTLEEKVMQLNQYTLGRNDNANNVADPVDKIPAEIGSLIYFDTSPELRNQMCIRDRYMAFAEKQIRTLASPEYTAPAGENGGFILRHSTGAYPFSSEVDVPLTYADYYYLEALTRIKRRLQP